MRFSPDIAPIIAGLLSVMFHGLLASLIFVFGSPDYLVDSMILTLSLILAAFGLGYRLAKCNNQLLSLMGLIYIVYFLSLPGLYQLQFDAFPWRDLSTYDPQHIWMASVTVLTGTVFLFLGYLVPVRQKTDDGWTIAGKKRDVVLMQSAILLALLLLALAFALYKFGLGELLSTRGQRGRFAGTRETLAAVGLMVQLPSAIGVMAFIGSVLALRTRTWLSWIVMFICLGANLILNYPLAVARYTFFGMLLAGLFTYVGQWNAKRAGLFFAVFIVSFLTVFQLAGQISRDREVNLDLEIFNPTDYLAHGDLDGFQSVANVTKLVDDRGLSYGNGLLSAALFFVPRAIWTHKEQPTGLAAAQNAGFDFVNVSSPIFSEFYHDFALPGVALGSLLLGLFAKWMERRHVWESFILAAFTIILMRGSLLAVISTPMIAIFGLIFTRFVAQMLLSGNRRERHRRFIPSR